MSLTAASILAATCAHPAHAQTDVTLELGASQIGPSLGSDASGTSFGVGGVRVLRAVGINPAAWHANEGHAAFMFVERLRELVESGVSFDDAVTVVVAAGAAMTDPEIIAMDWHVKGVTTPLPK